MKANNLFNNAITLPVHRHRADHLWRRVAVHPSLDRSRSKGVKKPMSASQRRTVDFLLNYALYIILLMILVIVCIIRPTFLDVTNLLNIVKQASTKGILALGCAGLIVLAGTDLSIGRVAWPVGGGHGLHRAVLAVRLPYVPADHHPGDAVRAAAGLHRRGLPVHLHQRLPAFPSCTCTPSSSLWARS